MLGFTPFKKHANKFNYIPRYYDPEKEAREQRRAELRGERAGDEAHEYVPGQFIRTQREARAAHRAGEEERGLLFIYLLYPKLAEVFLQAAATQPAPAANTEAAEDGFDPYAPIRVVPNDYEE